MKRIFAVLMTFLMVSNLFSLTVILTPKNSSDIYGIQLEVVDGSVQKIGETGNISGGNPKDFTVTAIHEGKSVALSTKSLLDNLKSENYANIFNSVYQEYRGKGRPTVRNFSKFEYCYLPLTVKEGWAPWRYESIDGVEGWYPWSSFTNQWDAKRAELREFYQYTSSSSSVSCPSNEL